MKSRIFGGIGVMALAFTLVVVGVEAIAHQAQAAEMKVDQKLQDCAKAVPTASECATCVPLTVRICWPMETRSTCRA